MSKGNKRGLDWVLPKVSLDKIAPPYPKYRYFEGCKEREFLFQAGKFEMQNAWWLIDASILAYSEEDFVDGIFLSIGGFDPVRFFNGPETDTQCYVANNDNFVIVAFRGTEVRKRKGADNCDNIIKDFRTDADIEPVDWEQGGKVHGGFKKALDEVWEDLSQCVSGLNDGTRTIWFTGHSLGAALATLGAARFGAVQGLYTFGSPRVGDAKFHDGFHVKTFRFVNNNDIVAKLPPPGLYRHVGELKHIDAYGRIHEERGLLEQMADSIVSDAVFRFDAWEKMSQGLAKLIPDSLMDHVPLLYAIHIWNSIP